MFQTLDGGGEGLDPHAFIFNVYTFLSCSCSTIRLFISRNDVDVFSTSNQAIRQQSVKYVLQIPVKSCGMLLQNFPKKKIK